MSSKQEQEFECCPPFDPDPWQDKLFEWNNKLFIKDKVMTAFYMPLNFGSVMKRLDAKVRSANAHVDDFMCLSDHKSKWKMDVYVSVNKTIPGADNVTLSGKFYSRVYEGDFKETAKWGEDFRKHAEAKNLKIKKWYMWYTTCPKCAKKYGKNYVVNMAEVE